MRGRLHDHAIPRPGRRSAAGRGRDPGGPAPYVARFSRARPAAMIAIGTAVLVLAPIAAARAVERGHAGQAPPALAAAVAALVLIGVGATRLARGRGSGGVAFAVDRDGVFFGAQPREAPRRFSWDEVSALVLFSRRTEFLKGSVRCVGVRLHPAVPGSPEHHLALLRRTLDRADLELHVWERLRELDASPPADRLELAVGFHVEVRGWSHRRSRLRAAMRAHAPGVPVVTAPAERYFDLVGWRADQEELRRALEDAELRHWR